MTHQSILTKAIETVMADGFKPDGIENVTSWKATVRGSQAWIRWFNNEGQEVIQDVEHVIFNHDFAKALWGTEKLESIERRLWQKYWDKQNSEGISDESLSDKAMKFKQASLWWSPESLRFEGEMWQYHLQQMVIADGPISYLGEHI